MDPTLTAQPNVLDQNCESRQTLDRVADKWSALVVYALVRGPHRHGRLRREIDGISQKMLTQTLRSMERDGLVTRRVIDQVPPHVEYELTPLGRTLTEPLVAICRWSMDHLPDVQQARAAYDAAEARAPREEATTAS
jgi:DNA-binding HxlR family transcriptional regulator